MSTSKYSYLLPVILIMSMSGCMTSKLIQKTDSDQLVPHKDTHWNLFWGLMPEKEIKAECGSENICQVEAKTNLGFQLISLLTIGIVVPQQIVWQCCPEDPDATILGDQ